MSRKANVPLSLDPNSMVTVCVGTKPDQQLFAAHESFLRGRSDFFCAALSGDRWEETQTRTIKLEVEDPRIFGMYLNHVYTGQIDTVRTELDDPPAMDAAEYKSAMQEEYADLFELYVLGEKLLDVSVKITALAAVFKRAEARHNGFRCSPSAEHLSAVYTGTPVGSPCRRLLIDYLASFNAEKLEQMFTEEMEIIPKEALVDLMLALRHQAPPKMHVPHAVGLEAYMHTAREESGNKTSRFTPLPLDSSDVDMEMLNKIIRRSS